MMTESSSRKPDARAEGVRRMRVNPVSLSFEKECAAYEKPFNQVYLQKSLKPIRIAVVLAIITWSSFGFLDLYIDEARYTALWTIRYGFLIPLFMIGYFLSYTSFFQKFFQPVVAGCAFASGLGVIDRKSVV